SSNKLISSPSVIPAQTGNHFTPKASSTNLSIEDPVSLTTLDSRLRHSGMTAWWIPAFAGMTVLVTGLSILAAPKPGEFYATGPTNAKRISLTFDDGPGPYTDQVLDLLEKYQVKATFFVLGELVQYKPDTVK